MHESLTSLWPGRFEIAQLAEPVSLGEGGLGLDSIEIVELVLECEQRLGRPVDVEDLLAAAPITLGRLVEHLAHS